MKSYSGRIQQFHKIYGNLYQYPTELEYVTSYKNCLDKSKITISPTCKIHGVFTKRMDAFLLGQGCPKCSFELKSINSHNNKSYNERIIQFREIHSDKYNYPTEVWWNENTPKKKSLIPITCKRHGEFYQRINAHIIGHGCPKCAKVTTAEKNKITYKEFIKQGVKIFSNFYNYPTEVWWNDNYKSSKTTIPIMCPRHGEFNQTICSHMTGHGCNYCARELTGEKTRLSYEEFMKNSKEGINYPTEAWWNDNYKSNRTKMNLSCNNGHTFKQSIGSHQAGSGCIQCYYGSGELNRVTHSEFISRVSKNHTVTYDYPTEVWWNDNYKTSHDYINIICPTHGIFQQIIWDHISGSDCPKCAGRISKIESVIVNNLQLFNLEIIEQAKIFDNKRMSVDIYIPSKNVAIEFNGVYWHNEKYTEDNYHKMKYDLCKEKGIRLISIFEDEWIQDETLVKKKLQHILGFSTDTKLYARKCTVVEVTTSDKRIFFNKNHIQGDGPSSINLGLYHDGQLVSVLGFINNKKGVYNLSRYATSCNVVGGFTKLLSYFEKEYKPLQIYTFADLRWSEGDLYYKSGFILDKILEPDYSYVVKNKRVHKFNYRHVHLLKKLKVYDPNLSEHQNCLNNKIYRIYDCGKMRFVKNYK